MNAAMDWLKYKVHTWIYSILRFNIILTTCSLNKTALREEARTSVLKYLSSKSLGGSAVLE